MTVEPRFRSAKAELRRQFLPTVGLAVLERWAATRPKGSVAIARFIPSSGREAVVTPENEITVQDSRLWLDPPARWRYEVAVGGGDPGAVFVTDGPLWWSYAPSLHAYSNESAPDRYPGQREHQEWHLFHPDEVVAELTVTSTRQEDRDGRRVELIEGVARADHVPSLPSGADTYHLVIDRDRGIALRMAASADGVEFSSVEITSLEMDVPLGPELFRIELPAGLTFTPPPDHRPRPTPLRRVLGRLHLGPRY